MVIYLNKVTDTDNIPDKCRPLLMMGRPENYYRGTPLLSFSLPFNIVSWLHAADTISRVDSFHHRYIWVLNLEGDCEAVVDHKFYPLRKSESILVCPFQYHHFIPAAGERLWLFIGFESTDPLPYESLKGRVMTISPELLTLAHTFAALYAEETVALQKNLLHNCDRTVLTLANMIAENFRLAVSDTRKVVKSRLSESLSAKIQRWIYNNVGRGVRISDAAYHFGLSESRLRARFKSEMGRSIGTVLAMLRFEKARSLLTSTDLRISEIANQSGYENVFAFSTSFKKRYGVSPREFRAQRH